MKENVISILGSISSWGYSKQYVKYYLDQCTGPVRVKVSSYGGDVNEAIAISKLFEEHGDVTIEFIGFNASAATWMAFGAKNIEIHEDTFFLVHNCIVPVDIYGLLSSDDIDAKIKELQDKKQMAEAINLVIAKKYLNRCESKKKTLSNVFDLMKRAQWMTADEIMEWGFADTLVKGKKAASLSNEVKNELMAHGFPVPQIENSAEDTSIVGTIKNAIKSTLDELFPKKVEEQAPEDSLNPNNIVMNKEFTTVNQLLNVEGFEVKDNLVTMTCDQVKALNEALDAANKKAESAQNELKTANEKAESIMNEFNSISDEVKNAKTAADKVAVIKEVLNKVPAVNVKDGKEDGAGFSDIAVDPINSYE